MHGLFGHSYGYFGLHQAGIGFKSRLDKRCLPTRFSPFRPVQNHWKISVTMSDLHSTDSSVNEPLTPTELSRILTDPEMNDLMQFALLGLPISTMVLRHFLFVSQSIERIETDLSYHRGERARLFRQLMRRRHFAEAIYPVMAAYRRHHSPTPHLRRPTSPRPTSIVADNGITRLSPDSPIPVLIHPLSEDYSDQQSAISSNESYHTPSTGDGTRANPIDVDIFEPPPLPPPTLVQQFAHRRTHSIAVATTCDMCARRGHTTNDCIWSGPILCNYCREVGHLRDACPELRQDIARYDPRYQFCVVCNQPGHTIDRCFALLHSQ